MTDRRCISRRDFLAAGAATTAAFSLSSSLFAAPKGKDRDDAPEKIDWKGFKMGIQSYSMRGFKLDKAIEECKKLQLYYWESFKDHLPVTTVPGEVAKQKELLDTNGIKLLAYGVLEFKDDETKAREYFDYAKAVGIETLSANPEKNEATFKLLDKLVEEYQINIAIHNHGPKARYDKIDDVVDAVKDHHPRIGACVDTGHYLRSSESPVEARCRSLRTRWTSWAPIRTGPSCASGERARTLLSTPSRAAPSQIEWMTRGTPVKFSGR